MSLFNFVVFLVFALLVRGDEDSSLLQKLEIVKPPKAEQADQTQGEPFIIGLRRESVPVYRRGKIASFKTSYSGVLHVGSPAQEFRVVFDTGSGNIILPAAECQSEACLVETRRKFNMSASSTAVAINQHGRATEAHEPADQVTIGFGTGEITGEFARDKVCFGTFAQHRDANAPPSHVADAVSELQAEAEAASLVENHLALSMDSSQKDRELCVEMQVILAVEMSTHPFKTFQFDGILGLGLSSLALSNMFSAFEMLLGTGLPQSHFGVFLTEGEDDEQSEIAFGGVDLRRTLEPLSWAPVAMADLGYWQIEIVAVRINGIELDICKDGTCRGVVDTGTSHLGIPASANQEVADLLTTEAVDILDCRLTEAPEMEIELRGYNITLHPFNYMRRLPLRSDVTVGSALGVHTPPDPSVASPPTAAENATLAEGAVTVAASAQAAPAAAATAAAGASQTALVLAAVPQSQEEVVKRFCRPRLTPVNLPAPLGPKLFILGEPVLHRYYTVYDWKNHRVGFSLANNRRNTMDPSETVDRRGTLPKEVDMLLMQQTMVVKTGGSSDAEDSMLVQMKVRITVRPRRCQ